MPQIIWTRGFAARSMLLWRYIIFTLPKGLNIANMPRPIHAQIHLSAVQHNLLRIKQLNPQAICMPVVKANAYGHGLSRIYPALAQADALALLEIEGAALLRELGWTKPIVLLEGCFDLQDFQAAVALKCDWVIHGQAQLDQTQALFEEKPLLHRPTLYLKLNTGMNRLGFAQGEAARAIAQIECLTQKFQLPTPVLMTHFANADRLENSSQGVTPLTQYDALQACKPAHWRSSLGNSGAAFNCPQWVGDILRPGIALYGASPGPHPAPVLGLQPAMALNSEVIGIQHVNQGQGVGYGSRWIASKNSRIAVVACGYADGYPRHAPDGTPVQVLGQRATLAGRVSMDMLTVDVTHLPQVREGSAVQLWGEQLPVDEVAQACGTIAYELLCAITPRVPFLAV